MIDDLQNIEKLLKASPEIQPPAELSRRIMEEISQRETSLMNRLQSWFLRTGNSNLSPAKLSLSLLLVAVASFWLGTTVEHSAYLPNHDQSSLLAPEMIQDAQASFLIGRGLMRDGKTELALAYLNEAEQLNPQDAEYTHWQGVAYWTLGQKVQEKQSYLRSLEKQPDFLPSIINLGHIALENRDYNQAVSLYNKVLEADPQSPEALFNKGLASLLGKKEDTARQAFADYLDLYPQGKWAERARRHLHRLHDFRYQTFHIGSATLVLNSAILLEAESKERAISLQRISRILALHPHLELQVVVFQKDKNQARHEALRLKDDLQAISPGIRTIRTSWFDISTIDTKDLTNFHKGSSLLIFTTQPAPNQKRNSA